MTFRNGPEKPVGAAMQGGADGIGRKFGFKHGSTSVHVYTPAIGPVLRIESRDKAPTLLSGVDGTALATIERGSTSGGKDVSGREVLRSAGSAREGITPDAFRHSPSPTRWASASPIRT
jgi:hypothetical protein